MPNSHLYALFPQPKPQVLSLASQQVAKKEHLSALELRIRKLKDDVSKVGRVPMDQSNPHLTYF